VANLRCVQSDQAFLTGLPGLHLGK
jgi:hypothetical protein